MSSQLGPAVASIPAGIGRLSELLEPALERAERRRSGEEQPVRTPWPQLDDILGGGMWPGAHFLVSGAGVGKSQLTFQLALHAAEQGCPVGLVALELDEMSLALRIASEKAGVTWSRVYNGQASEQDMARVRTVLPDVQRLDIRTDFGAAMGWPIDRLELMARELRKGRPKGPALIVLDFIQLVSSPPNERLELRELIRRAGYAVRNVARRFDISIVVVSSTARANYAVLTQKFGKLGLGVDTSSRGGKRRTVRFPDLLIGLGKESGELEFAADSLTVLCRPTITQGACGPVVAERQTRGEKLVTVVVPKMRAGAPSWFAMMFHRGRFSSLSDDEINALASKADDDSDSPDATDDLVFAAIAEQATNDPLHPLKSVKAVADAAGKRSVSVGAAIKRLLESNRIKKEPLGYVPKDLF